MSLVTVALCLCDPSLVSYPAPGSVDVPTNVVPVARASRYEDQVAEVALRDGDGERIDAEVRELSRERFAAWVEVRPLAPLAPRTAYTLAHDHVQATFVTRDGEAEMVPGAPVVESVEAGHQPFRTGCSSSCYSSSARDYIDVRFGRTEDAVYYEIELTDGEAALMVAHVSHAEWRWQRFDNAVCSLAPPPLSPGDELCVRVTAISLTGVRSSPSNVVCTTVRGCAAVDPCALELRCEEPGPEEPDGGDGQGGEGDAGQLLLPEPQTQGQRQGQGGCSVAGGAGGGAWWVVVLALMRRLERAGDLRR